MDNRYTLAQLNDSIRGALLDAFPGNVWVMAEISEMKQNRNGHCYMELIEKEGNTIVARMRATIWSYAFRMLKPYFETSTGQTFTSGIKVLVQVSVEFHSAYGLSLNIKDIDPTYTLGDLAMQRKEIIRKLEEDGVLNMNKELELPLAPQKIAIISSATAAGLQDFMDQLDENVHGFRFYTKLFEATMQGAETVPTIINALERIYAFEEFFDLVVIIRGGGATADLNSFDNYDLAYNITQFPLPVITGIGHEKDDTIVDLVAHTRLKTPTAVAEFLIMGLQRFSDKLLFVQQGIIEKVQTRVEVERARIEQVTSRMDYEIKGYLSHQFNQLHTSSLKLKSFVGRFAMKREMELGQIKDKLSGTLSMYFLKMANLLGQRMPSLKRVVDRQIDLRKNHIERKREQIENVSRKTIQLNLERLQMYENSIRLLSPENVLKRGFSLTTRNGKIVKDIDQVQVDDVLETRLAKGLIESKILKKHIKWQQKN